MPRTKKIVDTIENSSSNFDSQIDPSDFSKLSDHVAEEVAKPVTFATSTPDLKTKYPSRSLEELRKIDFVHQYESRLPLIKRPGYVVAWICNTPRINYRDIFYKVGYDYLDINEYPPVSSGYSDLSGEDKYDHYAMQIPKEIYDKSQKALEEMTKKMYGHILNPDKKGRDIEGDGMYDPKGREVKTVTKVLIPNR
jgi:hypothetical protein